MHGSDSRLRVESFVLAASLMWGAVAVPVQAQADAARTGVQTLRGAAAQNSPQAEVFLAYEEALLSDGIEAASRYMSPAKRDEMQNMLKASGAAAFERMQAERRASQPPPAVRRRQIDTVEITGDYAVLEARTERQGAPDRVAFLKTSDGWKVTSSPGVRQWVGPFPIPPGATQDHKQGGRTSLGPGRNYVVAMYTIEKPLEEIVRYYETALSTNRWSEEPDGSVRLKTDAGSVRLTGSGRQTRIRIAHGPQ